jgi:glycosyltransferase involved in cell wall biosynthesis
MPPAEPARRYESKDLPELPQVTVFIPCRNEAGHIADTLNAVLGQTYLAERMSILLVDGMSTDETRRVARETLSAQDKVRWKIVDNPLQDLTNANLVAYEHITGDVFVYVCAHATIADDYVEAVCRGLREVPCDGIGGPYRMVGRTPNGQAIAAAMSSPFGVGGAWYRYFSEDKPVDCDPPMASYRTEVLRQIGGMDPVTLGFGEDWEYYRRARAAGARLYCDPRIHCRFYARDRFTEFLPHMGKYGTAKGWLWRRYGSRVLRWTHLLPTAWVAYVGLSTLFALLGHVWALALLVGGMAGYLLAGLWSAVKACRAAEIPVSLAPRIMLAYAIMHGMYGVFFVKGALVGRGRAVERKARELEARLGGIPSVQGSGAD